MFGQNIFCQKYFFFQVNVFSQVFRSKKKNTFEKVKKNTFEKVKAEVIFEKVKKKFLPKIYFLKKYF